MSVEAARRDLEIAPADSELFETAGRRFVRRSVIGGAEVLVAVMSALLFMKWSASIRVDPLDRIGQVSGLASLQLRFAALGVVLLAVLLVGYRTRRHQVVVRLVCAAVAGLTTGLIAGGVVVALLGSELPLNGDLGDSSVLAAWAESVRAGGQPPETYPPLFVWALAGWADVSGTSSIEALKPLELVTTSLFGPAAYLAWRTILSPLWALGVGLGAALPLIAPYKPYSTIVLVVLVPLVVLFLRSLRASAAGSYRWILLAGAAFGAAFAVLFLAYSGWYVWSAPGVLAAVLLHFPWRTGWRRGIAFLATSAVVFFVLAARHLVALLTGSGDMTDRFFYFDVYVDPAYFAMARGSFPQNAGPWPPPGEFGGVGLFTLLLAIGLAAAIALGMTESVVITAGCLFASAWLLRFYFASQMYQTKAVQLYPRTTAEILYCLLILSGFAAYLAARRIAASSWLAQLRAGNGRPLRPATGATAVGTLCAVLLLFGSAGSAISDQYMPREGNLAWISHYMWRDGHCSASVPRERCIDMSNTSRPVPRVAV